LNGNLLVLIEFNFILFFKKNWKWLLSSYILGAIHIEVFCEITMAFAEDDNYLVAAMEKFQYLTLGSLGVQQIFQLDDSFLLEPVDYFSTLGIIWIYELISFFLLEI